MKMFATEHEIVIRCRSCSDKGCPADVISVGAHENGFISLACLHCGKFVYGYTGNKRGWPYTHYQPNNRNRQGQFYMMIECNNCLSRAFSVTLTKEGFLTVECYACEQNAGIASVDVSKEPKSAFVCECCGKEMHD